MNLNFIIILLSFIGLILNAPSSYAFDNKITHPDLVLETIDYTILDEYLQDVIDFQLGITEELEDLEGNSKFVYKWIQEGSRLEDIPNCRASNHFHNPVAESTADMTAWENAGLNDHGSIFIPLIDFWCNISGPYNDKYSNLVWATDYESPGVLSDNQPINDRDWKAGRNYFYWALVFPDDTLRKAYFAETFKTLGYVLHLLQDVAVPAHTRNDFSGHLRVKDRLRNPFEKFMMEKDFYNDVVAGIQEDVANGKLPSNVIRFAGIQELTGFWDTDHYNPSNSSPTNGTDIGLAEYSNSNFVSVSTIFRPPSDEDHYFTYPSVSGTNLDMVQKGILKQVEARDGKIDMVPYISKIGEGETIDHFLAIRYIWNGEMYPHLNYKLDRTCYLDYAKKIIPRTIGYSANLIDYFFRGKIEVKTIRPDDLAISVIEGMGNRISGLRVYLRNATMDQISFDSETMGAGSLVAVAKYTTADGIEYSVSDEILINDQNNNYVINDFKKYEFNFTASNTIPYILPDTEILIVFKGTLGNEQDIAVAVGHVGLFDTGIEITPPSEFVYSIIDGGSTQEFTKIKASVRNDLAGKQIQGGTLTAVAMYRNRINYEPGLSDYEPPSYSDSVPDFTFSTSAPLNINGMDSLTPEEYSFDFTAQPIPAGITDLYLYIVFEGTLLDGQDIEPGSIVAGLKDLSEPDHRVFWNSTDQIVFSYFYENNNNDPLDSLFYLDNFKNSPPDYWANLWCMFVDLNCNGITSEINSGNPELYVDPYDISYQLHFSGVDPQSNQVNLVQVAEINNLPPGEHSRIIILTDRSYNQLVWQTEYITRHYIPDPLPGKPAYLDKNTTNYLYTYGVVNQLFDVTWSYTDLEPPNGLHRGVGQHRYSGEYICIAPLGNECLYLGDERPVPADLSPYPATINF